MAMANIPLSRAKRLSAPLLKPVDDHLRVAVVASRTGGRGRRARARRSREVVDLAVEDDARSDRPRPTSAGARPRGRGCSAGASRARPRPAETSRSPQSSGPRCARQFTSHEAGPAHRLEVDLNRVTADDAAHQAPLLDAWRNPRSRPCGSRSSSRNATKPTRATARTPTTEAIGKPEPTTASATPPIATRMLAPPARASNAEWSRKRPMRKAAAAVITNVAKKAGHDVGHRDAGCSEIATEHENEERMDN